MCGSSPAGEVGEAGGGWGQKGDLSRALNGVGDTEMSREEEAAETMHICIYFQLTPLMKAVKNYVDIFSLVPLSMGHL